MNEQYNTVYGQVTDDDWSYCLGFTPIEYIQYIQNGLKYNNRFFVDNRFNKLLHLYASSNEAQRYLYPNRNKILYRARIFPKGLKARNPIPPFHGYNAEESFVPSKDINISEGRGNPALIRYLYAASDINTAIAEVSPKINDTISVAEIQIDEQIHLLDFAKAAIYIQATNEERTKWFQQFVLDLTDVFQTPFHEKYDYLLCQYICELIKNIGFDGIAFNSSRVQQSFGSGEGTNFTIFNYTGKCYPISSELYYVSNIKVEHQKAPS